MGTGNTGILPYQSKRNLRTEPSAKAIAQSIQTGSEVTAWPIHCLTDRAEETRLIGDVHTVEFECLLGRRVD